MAKAKRGVTKIHFSTTEVDRIIGAAARREKGRVRITSGQRQTIKLRRA